MPTKSKSLDSTPGLSRNIPIIINGQKLTTEQCAQFANQVLRDAGYLSRGNAWDSKGSDIVFSGYDSLKRPEVFDSLAVMKYNNDASDSVYRNFDSKTLDTSIPYLVNMYYTGSPALREAYENGTQGRTGTHTGYLIHDGKQWNVVHNIHGTAHVDKFTNVQGGNKKYGVTSIFKPRKASLLNTVKTRLGLKNGGGIYIKPENRGKFTATMKRIGKTAEELSHSSNPLTRKRAIFALNARKWKH